MQSNCNHIYIYFNWFIFIKVSAFFRIFTFMVLIYTLPLSNIQGVYVRIWLTKYTLPQLPNVTNHSIVKEKLIGAKPFTASFIYKSDLHGVTNHMHLKDHILSDDTAPQCFHCCGMDEKVCLTTLSNLIQKGSPRDTFWKTPLQTFQIPTIPAPKVHLLSRHLPTLSTETLSHENLRVLPNLVGTLHFMIPHSDRFRGCLNHIPVNLKSFCQAETGGSLLDLTCSNTAKAVLDLRTCFHCH